MNALRAFSASSLTAVPRAGLRSAARPAACASLRRAEIRPSSGRASLPFGATVATARTPAVLLRATADMATAAPSADAAAFISSFNADYARIHESYENNFWETKMNLEGNSTDALTKSLNELEAFLGDQSALETTRKLLAGTDGSVTEDQKVILRQIEKTLLCYIVESAEARAVRDPPSGRKTP